jgi:hypothetical protein
MKFMKLLSLLLLLALPVMAQAQFTFTINSGAITITHYTGSGGAVTIPGRTAKAQTMKANALWVFWNCRP